MQSAYQILVAGSEEKLRTNVGDKWDSGKTDSDRSVNVHYRGSTLASGETCCWKVRVWDKQGRPSPWSLPGSFEMGLLKPSDWKGQWIGIGPGSLTYVAGRLTQAVQLDGEGETIRIPHSAKLKPAAHVTISAWIKPTECTGQWREIVSDWKKDGHSLTLDELDTQTTSATLRFDGCGAHPTRLASCSYARVLNNDDLSIPSNEDLGGSLPHRHGAH